MREQEWIARFNRDLDALVQGDEPEPAEAAPAEYQQMLALARTLASTDLSAGRAIRQPLRRRLLTGAGPVARRPRPRVGGAERSPALLLPLVLFALVATGVLAWGVVRAWPAGAPSGLGTLALTASPTFAQAAGVSTPRGPLVVLLTAVPAPTAGNSLSVGGRAPAAGTRPVVPSDKTTPAEARTVTGLPQP